MQFLLQYSFNFIINNVNHIEKYSLISMEEELKRFSEKCQQRGLTKLAKAVLSWDITSNNIEDKNQSN